ncbi:MAG: mechanosensitive ion channel family protein [Bacteroidales bacterium]|nr:mechanosensitive ion channel family protein [Bacteroidales bacterium]
MKRKYIIVLAAALLVAGPALAVFNERDLGQTIKTLRDELSRDYRKRVASEKLLSEQYRNQRRQMIATMKKCNELSLILYSQKQDFTFDLTYALESVTNEYNEFTSKRLPYDQIVSRLDWDIDRYARLVESLRRLPPEIEKIESVPDSLAYHNDSLDRYAFRPRRNGSRPRMQMRVIPDSLRTERPFILNEEECEYRDSCIFYASEMLKMCAASKDRIIRDSTHYQHTFLRLKESYDYAEQRYKVLQNRIFVQGQTPYTFILRGFGRFWNRAMMDVREKYSRDYVQEKSMWKGPFMGYFLLFQFGLLIVSTLVAAVVWLLLRRFIKGLRESLSKQQFFCLILLSGIILNLLLTIGEKGMPGGFLQSASTLMRTYLWLLAAIIAALLIRLKSNQINSGLLLYLPMMIMAVVVIGLRIVFMPNSMMNILFPPILLLFFIWQLVACIVHRNSIHSSDRFAGWVSLIVTGVALIVSLAGYIFVALLIMIWWFFMLSAALTLVTVSHLLEQFRDKYLVGMVEEYKKRLTFVSAAERDNLLFGVTWPYDLVKMVVIPVLTILSIPFSIKLALNVFDFTDLFETIYLHPFVNLKSPEGTETLRISFKILVTAGILFFIFRFINYALYAVYQNLRYSSLIKKTGRRTIRKNEVNFSLGKSIINTSVWLVYIITLVIMLRIPTASLTIIAGGLSAGIGIALKDVLNNFIYGIQLMSGRLRVGDWIECDGIRGKVTKISYQSTQIETLEGGVMSFLNATLFNKNFSNLTHNNSYEFVKIVVGVEYGTDMNKVREVLVDALQVLREKDLYGREIVDPKKGIYVVFDGFEDSAVNVAVKQYVLVSERTSYVDKAKEVIYGALGKAGINIPFPQRDVHVISE